LYYRLSHKFGFIQKGHVAKPWSRMPWHAQVWRLMVSDFCGFMLTNDVLQYSPLEFVQYLYEIRQIIADSALLSPLEFPLLDMLEQKVFQTWQAQFSQ
jgi:hypothetical protein